MLYCDIKTEELVRELGKLIYTDVVLSGEAVWYRANSQMKSLTVSSFSPAKTGSFVEVVRQLSGSSGNAWDKITDPEEYLREMRG